MLISSHGRGQAFQACLMCAEIGNFQYLNSDLSYCFDFLGGAPTSICHFLLLSGLVSHEPYMLHNICLTIYEPWQTFRARVTIKKTSPGCSDRNKGISFYGLGKSGKNGPKWQKSMSAQSMSYTFENFDFLGHKSDKRAKIDQKAQSFFALYLKNCRLYDCEFWYTGAK